MSQLEREIPKENEEDIVGFWSWLLREWIEAMENGTYQGDDWEPMERDSEIVDKV